MSSQPIKTVPRNRTVRFPQKIRSSIYNTISTPKRSLIQQKETKTKNIQEFPNSNLTDRQTKIISKKEKKQKQNTSFQKKKHKPFPKEFSKTFPKEFTRTLPNRKIDFTFHQFLGDGKQTPKRKEEQKIKTTHDFNLLKNQNVQKQVYRTLEKPNFKKGQFKEKDQRIKTFLNQNLNKSLNIDPLFSKKLINIRQSEILTFSEQKVEFIRTPSNNNKNKNKNNDKNKKKNKNDMCLKKKTFKGSQSVQIENEISEKEKYKQKSLQESEKTTKPSKFSRKSKVNEQSSFKNIQSKIHNSYELTPKKNKTPKQNDLQSCKQKPESLLNIKKPNLKNKSDNNNNFNSSSKNLNKSNNNNNNNFNVGDQDEHAQDQKNSGRIGSRSSRSRSSKDSTGNRDSNRDSNGGSRSRRIQNNNDKNILGDEKNQKNQINEKNSKKIKKEKSFDDELFQRKWKLGDFKFQKIIGEGQFGKVYLAQDKFTQRLFAIKVLTTTKIQRSGGTKQLAREINVQTTLRHPNILKMYGYCYDRNHFFLILEYAQGGELYQRLINSKKFTEEQAANYITSLYCAVDYFHSKNVIHRDLKPENVLVTKDGVLKIADFGFSVFTNPYNITRNTFCGTLDYLPPEMVVGNSYDHSVDKWSLGVLLYEFLVGAPPFETRNRLQTYQKIAKVKFTFPNHVSNLAQDLVKKMLKKNPSDRISFQQFLNHPWIKKHVYKKKLKNIFLEHQF
ncbi:aurora a [Anaeramoeba flamelloides]|uniref:Aurora kinase n=1 Tax=Anaeramoeba flamelloides TaxID=1746091 RepID=A0AAV7YNV0_9EUKA|nr:aurora a [Anaeramoeba flamelloides]